MAHPTAAASGSGTSSLHSPRMLSDAELSRLGPTECAALCEQVDQNIVSVLQKIDESFVASTRTITDVLLPSVEAYGRDSKEIWDSVKVRGRTPWPMVVHARS